MTNSLQTNQRPRAVVTGASAGLGKIFAQQLAERGYDLVLVARDAERLRTLADDLAKHHGIVATVHAADLATDAGMRGLADQLASDDRLALLVNNAGFGTKGLLHTRDVAEQSAMIALHCLAPMILIRAALPGMLARKRGTIINVSSVASFTANLGQVNYCATKAYERVMIESLAMEVAGTGVNVQALCPGWTVTEFHDRASIDRAHVPSWAWAKAEPVVRTSLEKALNNGPVVVVPGLLNKMLVLILRYTPWWMRGIIQKRYARSRL